MSHSVLQLRDALELKRRPARAILGKTDIKALCALRLARILVTWSLQVDGRIRDRGFQLMQVYSQISSRTTLPRNASTVSGVELTSAPL
jgi:hypothetical protein